jgi:hypothetical protein
MSHRQVSSPSAHLLLKLEKEATNKTATGVIGLILLKLL